MEPIRGVATTIAGFVGRAATGPAGEARLVTSAADFASIYGEGDPPDHLGHGVRAFFGNGGRRLYVSRDDGDLAAALVTLEAVAEIAIVAAPGADAAAAEAVVAHAEQSRFRFAIVDPPAGGSVDEVRRFRAGFDSSRAALYYPWVRAGGLLQPPSGFVAGVYARGDDARGVIKAPAGDEVRGVTGVEAAVGRDAQAVLNPEGINLLRELEGEGVRIWGARTMSSDPEWKYVNIRRYVSYLERSLDEGTSWAVFEPNGEALWASVRRLVEDFLGTEWRAGNLMGRKPEDAYFVRCDRTTMTQDDVDHGRLVVLVGVAPVRPAEFVIFRIGQATADATR